MKRCSIFCNWMFTLIPLVKTSYFRRQLTLKTGLTGYGTTYSGVTSDKCCTTTYFLEFAL